jgi:predicted DNA-binding transcriptional regulator AlpA
MNDTPKLLNKRQLAEWLQVSQRTVDRWTTENRFPDDMKVTVAGTPRYRADIAAEWIDAGCPRSSCDLRDIRNEQAQHN